MSNFYVINNIEIGTRSDELGEDHDGPVAKGPDGKDQEIHLSQGSIDGACGPYSLMMALLICGLIDRDDLVSLCTVDGRTSPGKLLKLLQKYKGFFRDGTNTTQLKHMLFKSYKRKLDIICPEDENLETDIRKFVKKQLDANHPVILWLTFSGSPGHWVVVVGYEYKEHLNDSRATEDILRARIPRKFLLLDPDDVAPTVSAWNGIVDAVGTGGRYPYRWWRSNEKANFHNALALCPKKKKGLHVRRSK